MKKVNVSSEIIVIDGNQNPKIPKKLKLKEHQCQGKIKFDPSRFKAIPASSKMKKGEAYINLEELIRRFGRNRTNRPANANVLDSLVKHFKQIPKKYREGFVYLLFLKTTYLSPNGELCIRALNYSEEGWYKTILFNSDHFISKTDLVVCI